MSQGTHVVDATRPHSYTRRHRLWTVARLATLALLFFACSSAWAAPACGGASTSQTLELPGLGVVHMGDFRYNSAKDEAELFGGICFRESSSNATLEAERMHVAGVESAPQITTTKVTLKLANYTLFAKELSGSQAGMTLSDISVVSPYFSGTAARATYVLDSSRTILSGVKLRIGDFRVESVAAGIADDMLVLQDVRGTTCACEGQKYYALASPSVRIDLVTGDVQIVDGVLETLGLRVALEPKLRLDVAQAALAPVKGKPGKRPSVAGVGPTFTPILLISDPVGAPLDEGTRVVVPFQLAPGLILDAGVAGFTKTYPPGPVALLKVKQGNLSAAVGRAGPGWHADGGYSYRFARSAGLQLSTSNRLWQQQGFLHDGTVTIFNGRRYRDVFDQVTDAVELGGKAFVSLTQQTLSGNTILSPRIGFRTTHNYSVELPRAGTFDLKSDVNYTYYPATDLLPEQKSQFGLHVFPSWSTDTGVMRTRLAWDHLFILGQSPFSTTFDRLTRRSVIEGNVGVYGLPVKVNFAARYVVALGNVSNTWRLLRMDVNSRFLLPAFSTENRTTLELAGLLNPQDPEAEAFWFGDVLLHLPDTPLELGVQSRVELKPQERGLKLLELYGSYPYEQERYTLRPFVGVNVAPFITGEPLPFISGYGLELAVKSCCGTFIGSYRAHDKTVKAAFDVRLSPDPTMNND